MSPRTRATIDDLYRVPENGKAELVDGQIVLMPPTGGVPGRAGGEIYVALRVYRADAPDRPTIYRSGDVTEAEPALPGWSMPVDALLP